MTEPKIIEVGQKELELFQQIRKHWQDVMLLVNNDVFEMQNGKITIHKDREGKIRKIEIEKIAWRE